MVNRAATAPGPGPHRPIRILIADDQELVRRGLEALLEVYGEIEVVAKAVDGVEAVRLAKSLHPDLVLMDCRMPIVDGLGATRILKECRPEIAVLALSMDPELKEAAMAAGADSFVAKGGPGAELVGEIRRAAESKSRCGRRGS